ncbi:MAG: shikimate dehydrogenase [Endomicrobiia bacterium]
MKIDAKTKLLGIIGYPIGHSLSPVLHSMLAKKYGLNYVYLAFEVSPSMFKNIKEAILTFNICGLNVTVPYKEKIMLYIDEIESLAKNIGAVNTIVNKDNKLIGYNTDIYGFIKSIEKININNETAFVIGCGGVSKAIICGLDQLGVQKVYVYDIVAEKMSFLKDKFGKYVVPVKKNDIEKITKIAKIIINATPLGMKENDPLPIDLELITKDHIVYDVVYNRETELIKYAKKINCRYVIDGKDMFVYQAANSFFLWTGIKPDIKFMYNLINKLIK